MPTIHQDWDVLKAKLQKIDKWLVARQNVVGFNTTVVFEIENEDYDPRIPIINEWPTKPVRHEKKVKSRPKKRALDIQTTPIRDVLSEDDSLASCSTEDSSRTTAYMKCSTDALVVAEPFEDEFARYKDDDFDETPIQKNLRKIRSDISIPKPQPVRIATPPPPPAPTPPPPSPPVIKKPREPDWADTEKQIRDKNWLIALKDFEFFKDKLKETRDEKVIKILKEAIERVIAADESIYLVSFLAVCYHIELKDENFFSELIKRIKSRLSTYERIKVFRNTSTVDPEFILENYIIAMTDLKQYLEVQDMTLTISINYLKFFFDPKTFFSTLFITSSGDETPRIDAPPNPELETKLLDIKPVIKQEEKENHINEFESLPDKKPIVKKEEKENHVQENEDIPDNILPRIPARKVTYKVDENGKPDPRFLKIQSSGRRAAFKFRL